MLVVLRLSHRSINRHYSVSKRCLQERNDTISSVLDALLKGSISKEVAADAVEKHFRDSYAGSTDILGVGNFARIDVNRAARAGFPEGKTAEHLVSIMKAMYNDSNKSKLIIATKVEPAQYEYLDSAMKGEVVYHPGPKLVHTVIKAAAQNDGHIGQIPNSNGNTRIEGKIAVLTAGTSDYNIAEEAALLLELSGVSKVQRVHDVGVAGLHRLLNNLRHIEDADIIIVCAGMDGALPSVVAGLVKAPVIAVPTSVGYGAAFGGIAPLLTMLNSCSPGVTVVNIDNGFGAAVAAYKTLVRLKQNNK